MQTNWKPRLVVAALVSGAAVYGCFNFEDARSRCEQDGRCTQPDGGVVCNPSSEEDVPDDDFQDTNCDGVDGMADGGIFVDPANGKEGALGTATDPVKRLGEALDRIRQGTAPRQVYLSQGNYNESGLVLDTQVSLYGAYGGRDNWQRQGDFVTHLDGGPVGLAINGIPEDAGMVLDRLSVSSANVPDSGMPSIALQVIDSQGVRLRYDTFTAGQGGPGTDGTSGARGTDGGSGADGGNAVQATAGSFGARGLSNCGGTNAAGGNGQDGVAGGYLPGAPGEMGQPPGLGGTGGTGGEAGAPIDGGGGFISCRAGDGGVGDPGKPGEAGSAGPGGTGMGELNGSQWVATQQGGPGDAGTVGGGGGGGGSGGACKREGVVAGAAGAGSGGGGSGGCSGGGGKGGGGGGASISVLLIRSNVTFEGNAMLRTRGGGRGGMGGEGGPGGAGGLGGPGGMADVISSGTYNSYGGNGGAGGTGGQGGPGGPGGGGGGGPSVGIWCSPDAGFVNAGTLDNQPANGGPGGTSAGGNAGQPGQQAPYQGCP